MESPPRGSKSLFKAIPQLAKTLVYLSPWPPGRHMHLVIDKRHKNECTCFSVTNSDGRCTDLLPPRGASDSIELQKGAFYKVIFKTKDYFAKTDRKCFYPWVEVCCIFSVFYYCLHMI